MDTTKIPPFPLFFMCFFSFASICEAKKKLILPDELPEVEVIQDGRQLRIQLEQTISIPLTDDDPILGQIWGLPGRRVVSDRSIFLIDKTAEEVYQYDLSSGEYLATVGGRGQGPGEYLTPTIVALNPGNRSIYIYDNLEVYRYDQQVQYLHAEEGYKQLYRLFFDTAGNRFHLENSREWKNSGWKSKILPKWVMNIHKLSPSGESVYNLILAPPDMTNLFEYINIYIGLGYSEKLNKLYYVEPWSYKVKEIDAESGDFIRQFGIKPANFKVLHDTKQIHDAMHSRLYELLVVDDKYLLLLYLMEKQEGSMFQKKNITCVAYDITSKGAIYSFPVSYEDTYEWLHKAGFWPTGTVSKDSFMYLYKPPLEENLETSNGRIEVFSVYVE